MKQTRDMEEGEENEKKKKLGGERGVQCRYTEKGRVAWGILKWGRDEKHWGGWKERVGWYEELRLRKD